MAGQRDLAEQLFEAALDLSPEDRADFLDRQCKGDPELRSAIESLLVGETDQTSFPEQSADEGLHRSTTLRGSFIGPYHLLDLIGEGGMGEVWLAEQKRPVRRRVAIKLIKVGMDTREVVARFESERQALALMDHPAIAKVFDAGSTPDGRPYFVMEFVAGIPITAYCDKHKLTVRQRMELFIHVCEGVQHAHQKAIIHRDLKPSNILVAEIDGQPMPRIIDFGVAKATSQKLTAGTMHTSFGTMVGTIGYMSPEQADPFGEDIDTRSDVYSLGAVLYELLTGTLPLDLNKLSYDEVLRRLRDQDAPRPSTKLSTLGGRSAEGARNRSSERPALVRQLRGDPDAIVLKALEKDRTHRYASASELAADIGRYLRNEPVTAHPPSTAYRARKYIRRHRLGVAVAAVAVLLLAGFAVMQSIALRRITRERDRADRITDFMTGMFRQPEPSEARGNTVTAREILDKASKEIDTGLRNDPELQAKMMYTMADTYAGLGLYARAQSLVERALAIQQHVLGPSSPDTLRSACLMAKVVTFQGHAADVEKMQRQTLNIQRKVLGPENPDTLQSMIVLADILDWETNYSEAEQLEREALAIRQRVLGPEHPDTLNLMSGVADTLRLAGRDPEAEKLAREALDIQRRTLGSEHPDTLFTMTLLSEVDQDEGHYAEAEKLQREALSIKRRVFGVEHATTLFVMSQLADTLAKEGHLGEAEALSREALETKSRVLGPEHPYTLQNIQELAGILGREGRYDEAEKLFRQVIETASRTGPGDTAAEAWYAFACMAAAAGRRDQAFEYLARAAANGYRFANSLETERDLKPLEGDPRLTALLARVRQNTATVGIGH
ncbi:MAG: tetratricopeptide repeat protein [Silvibacterium sp.]|nr:tetratricopeptide repeat protein [Silvibacterium sp.]